MKRHWKQLTNPDYIGAYDFQPGEERIVTVKEVKRQQVTGPDGKKEECTVCHFEEAYKPMILNVTNCKMITKLSGTPYVEDWTGCSFKLIVVKVKAFGDVVDALRIKSEQVTKGLPVLEQDSTNFKKCLEAVKSGKFTIEQIKQKYSVSATVEALLV